MNMKLHRNDKGQLSCSEHPESYDLKCGLCLLAAAAERGRSQREADIHALAITYLKDGLSPEEAETKARDCMDRLNAIHAAAGARR